MLKSRSKQYLRVLLCITPWLIDSIDSLECSSFTGQRVHTVTESQINDNFCDCPLTGEDEPNTGACSGSFNWPGVFSTTEGTYTCPEQGINLPYSKLNDGICDCCDGSDEKSGLCPDICDAVLAEEREKKRQLQEKFDTGNNLRMEKLKDYQRFIEEQEAEIGNLEMSIDHVQSEKMVLEYNAKQEKDWLHRERLYHIENVLQNEDWEWIKALKEEEVDRLLLGMCQLAGEGWKKFKKTMKVLEEEATCIPLHLAAFDLGYGFDDSDPDNLQFKKWEDINDEVLWDLFMDLELGYVDPSVKKEYDSQPRHSPTERYDEDDGYEYHSSDDSEDDYVPGMRDRDYRDEENFPPHDDPTPSKLPELDPNDDAFIVPRSEIIKQASSMHAHIHEMFKEASQSDDEHIQAYQEENPDDEEIHTPPDIDTLDLPPDVDPIALQKAYNDLRSLLDTFAQSKDYVDSALYITRSMKKSPHFDMEFYYKLLIALMHHTRISASDLAELLHHVIPEIQSVFPSTLCPPTTITRTLYEEKNVQIPSHPIVDLASTRCEEREQLISDSCQTNIHIPPHLTIPTANIDKGCLANHFSFEPANEERQLLDFAYIHSKLTFPDQAATYNNLIKQISALEKKRDNLRDTISGDKLGPKGELYVMKDQCFEKDTVEYNYKICLLEHVHQKSKNNSNSGDKGTHLGNFDKFNADEMTVHFTKGLRCWQGNQRESTVEIKCGSELGVVLSAEEPEVCKYEFIVESFVGCNEKFARENGLLIPGEEEERVCEDMEDGQCVSP